MKWKKRGLIFTPEGTSGLISSHTQIPTVLVLDARLRIYYAARPSQGLSLTTYIDVDVDDPQNILYVHDQPVLQLGEAGMFDEHGIMPNHVMRVNGEIYLYYVGWSRRLSVDYSNWIGLAVSHDDGRTFQKKFAGPVVDRTTMETLSATGIFTLQHNSRWHMWYATGKSWQRVGDKLEHTYELRYGTSTDGIHWERENLVVIEPRLANESNTRPCVIKKNNRWHMWFCYRGIEDFRDGKDAYRIGYAWSDNLVRWHRDDGSSGFDMSPEGWDSKMTAYPYVVKVKDRWLMFYNGNGFGRSGIGYAELMQ